ncbi:aromatic acid exporter family protein [Arthrobacter sp. H5]|uniref:aromatic acid exporter family protein n=1 Tax=Arthrobacter sp. H5 TaxID=1267973 RepID=UPI0020A62FA7|nr:aromatic acid exporter family protein [Arthrobacter sp. H5]
MASAAGKTANQPLGGRLRGLLLHQRLLLALKAGLAAAIAWWIALQVPGVASQYPYYAPLGAVACMYPTIAGSAKQGFQTLVGLAVGFVLAIPVILLGAVSVLSVALVVGMGVLLAGLPKLGAGRDWIPIAALFVLLLGGDDPDGYSFGYLLQMLVGVLVGLGVNMLIFPPLHLNGVVHGLADLRGSLARQLADMGAAINESWPPEHAEWAARQNQLTQLGREVRSAVQLADSSRHGNMRQRRHNRDLNADYDSLRAMERVAFHVEDMTEILAGIIWRSPESTPLPPALVAPLAEAVTRTGAAIESWDPEESHMTDAEDAVEHLIQQINHRAADNQRIDAIATLGMGLRRILLTIRAESDIPVGG